MFELAHLAAAYAIGTAAGLWIFRTWIKEGIITATIDTLIEQGYLISYVDDDGITQLNKWNDVDAIDKMEPNEIMEILEELIKEEEEANKHEDEDDTP